MGLVVQGELLQLEGGQLLQLLVRSSFPWHQVISENHPVKCTSIDHFERWRQKPPLKMFEVDIIGSSPEERRFEQLMKLFTTVTTDLGNGTPINTPSHIPPLPNASNFPRGGPGHQRPPHLWRLHPCHPRIPRQTHLDPSKWWRTSCKLREPQDEIEEFISYCHTVHSIPFWGYRNTKAPIGYRFI